MEKFTEALKNMKFGDVIQIKFEDECCDYITKTRFFENMQLFIVGGGTRAKTGGAGEGRVCVIDYYDEDVINYEELAQKIKDILGEEFIVEESATSKGNMNIEYVSKEVFGSFKADNFTMKRP